MKLKITFTLTLASLCCLPGLFAQEKTGDDQKSTEKAEKKLPPESPEHSYARRSYTQVLGQVLKYWREHYPDPNYPYAKLADGIATLRNAEWNPTELMPLSEQLAQVFERESKNIRRLKLQMDSADLCVDLYRATIDKKASDLTTRESDLMKGCKELDNYPPPTAKP